MRERSAGPVRLVGRFPEQLGGNDVVSVGDDIRMHRDGLSDDAFHRQAPGIHGGSEVLDRNARCLQGHDEGAVIAPCRFDHRIGARH